MTNSNEDILIDSEDKTRAEEANVVIDESNPNTCMRCGFVTTDIEACLAKCLNCGAVRDCSDSL